MSASTDELLATWLALRKILAPESRDAEGLPCCCACGRGDDLKSVTSGVFACRSCLETP